MGVLIFVLRTALLRLCISEIMRPPLQWRHYDQLKIECHLKHPSPTSENMVYWPPEPFHQSEDRREFFYKNYFSKKFLIRKKNFFSQFSFLYMFHSGYTHVTKNPIEKVTRYTRYTCYNILKSTNN